jgi:uncharacterized protein involved in exopolysaccharide biosynthesis
MNDRSLVARDNPVTEFVPSIPRDLTYPGLSLAQILSMLGARWKLVLVIGFTVLSMTVVAMKFWPRTYTAVASLMVHYEVNDPLNGKDLPPGQVGSYIATQVELMQTPEVLLAVVDSLDLTSDRHYVSGYRGDGTLREWAAARLGRNLAIYQGQRGSQLIYVNYSARSAIEAARIANTVAEIYKAQDLMRATDLPGQRATLYAQQLDALKAKVDQAQDDLAAFHQRNGLIDEGEGATVDVVLLTTLEGRLLEAQNARRVAAARASGNQAVSDQALASPQIHALKARLSEQELRLADLNQRFLPQYPDIIDLQVSMAATRRSLADALESYSANAAGELGVAEQLEQSLQVALAAQRTKVLATGKLHAEAARYFLDLDSARAAYKRVLEGYDQIMFAAGGRYSNVTLISRATPPVRASAPRIKAGLLFGGMMAVILALGIPLTLELFNRRVRNRDDLESHYGIPVLVEFRRLTMDVAE